MEFKDKVMLHCFRKVNFNRILLQEFDIRYTSGLIINELEYKSNSLRLFSRRGEYEFVFQV